MLLLCCSAVLLLQAEPYHKPVQLSDETEAVLARCGDSEKLLTRVVRKAARLPPEPPLALFNADGSFSFTSSGEGEAAGPGAASAATSKQLKAAEGAEETGKEAAATAEAEAGGEKASAGEEAAAAGDAAAAAADTTGPAEEAAGQAAVGAAAGGKEQGAGTGGTPERLNVMIIFIDSLGRRHFFRRMPKAAAALEAVAKRGTSKLYQASLVWGAWGRAESLCRWLGVGMCRGQPASTGAWHWSEPPAHMLSSCQWFLCCCVGSSQSV